jgi:hypothetical protein
MSFRKEEWVVCINDEGIEFPNFELVRGKSYLVYDIKVRPGLLSRHNMKLVFQATDGTLVEISSKRFKMASDEV